MVVVERVVLLSHSCRVPELILSSDYCLCEVYLHALPVSAWVFPQESPVSSHIPKNVP